MTRARGNEDAHRDAGYNLVVLVIAVTVLNILVAAMLPLWSTAIRREKEEELVFRGFQYAEAIRVFHQRYQRYPDRLDELMEVKPRCIRQLWKDPMTDDGKWRLIHPNQPVGARRQRTGQGQERQNPSSEDPAGGEDSPPSPVSAPRKGTQIEVGPIIGVQSLSDKKSILVLFGRERYDEWQFTENLLLGGAPQGVGPTGTVQQQGQSFSTRWLGRPMRFMNQTPGATPPNAVQDGSLPGDVNGRPTGGRPTKPRGRP